LPEDVRSAEGLGTCAITADVIPVPRRRKSLPCTGLADGCSAHTNKGWVVTAVSAALLAKGLTIGELARDVDQTVLTDVAVYAVGRGASTHGESQRALPLHRLFEGEQTSFHRCLTFDMSVRRKRASRAFACPLDGVVRRHRLLTIRVDLRQ
jgi:hypothetical protein